jgi:hypothetical protein
MPKAQLLEPAELRELLRYDPESGHLYWRSREPHQFRGSHPEWECARWNTRYAGRKAGTITDGYVVLRLDGRGYRAHRVAWALHFGVWPDGELDHENRIRFDNRISNLREAPRPVNMKNLPRRRDNKTGVTGVKWCRNERKYKVRIGKTHLGTFDDFDAAVATRRAAEIEHGYHPSHGR